MTKKHFIRAADIVRTILNGEWTSDAPDWADADAYASPESSRAVQTAEAFIMLFSAQNDRFDVDKFLGACGLQQKGSRK